jgi:hypothetical protein
MLLVVNLVFAPRAFPQIFITTALYHCLAGLVGAYLPRQYREIRPCPAANTPSTPFAHACGFLLHPTPLTAGRQ